MHTSKGRGPDQEGIGLARYKQWLDDHCGDGTVIESFVQMYCNFATPQPHAFSSNKSKTVTIASPLRSAEHGV